MVTSHARCLSGFKFVVCGSLVVSLKHCVPAVVPLSLDAPMESMNDSPKYSRNKFKVCRLFLSFEAAMTFPVTIPRSSCEFRRVWFRFQPPGALCRNTTFLNRRAPCAPPRHFSNPYSKYTALCSPTQNGRYDGLSLLGNLLCFYSAPFNRG